MDEATASRHRGLRRLLEDDFRLLAEAGLVPPHGERELVFRIDKDGNVKWLTVSRWRMPASEIEAAG